MLTFAKWKRMWLHYMKQGELDLLMSLKAEPYKDGNRVIDRNETLKVNLWINQFRWHYHKKWHQFPFSYLSNMYLGKDAIRMPSYIRSQSLRCYCHIKSFFEDLSDGGIPTCSKSLKECLTSSFFPPLSSCKINERTILTQNSMCNQLREMFHSWRMELYL